MPDGRLLMIVVRDGLMSSLRRLANVVAAIGLFIVLACPPAAQAISPVDLGASRPDERVLDDAEVFSRASRSELNARLQDLAADRVDARVVTLRRLDYGLNLDSFGEELLAQWSSEGSEPLLLLLIETQNKRASIAADPTLQSQLPETLLTSTARTTMSVPLREGDRYRQATLDGINRLSTVLGGGEDPGPPAEFVRTTLPTNIPTQEETESSNATTWIIVLLVLGTIIPMATWWVFSR
ncbi:integral membrane protein involved in the photoprotection of photosystem II [Synechococcus sp. A18-46.1]|nr:integral membrane protein involved in the photoprotection of photosystem II [Synechococcus sp. A18-46.1]